MCPRPSSLPSTSVRGTPVPRSPRRRDCQSLLSRGLPSPYCPFCGLPGTLALPASPPQNPARRTGPQGLPASELAPPGTTGFRGSMSLSPKISSQAHKQDPLPSCSPSIDSPPTPATPAVASQCATSKVRPRPAAHSAHETPRHPSPQPPPAECLPATADCAGAVPQPEAVALGAHTHAPVSPLGPERAL